MNIFQAKKDIAAGQELFYRYGGAEWFEQKKLPHTHVDYASTKWRPDLAPLPCCQNVLQTIGVDGRRGYAVLEVVPSGTVLEISVCLEVPVVVVDQFPFLWDFVLTGEMQNVHAGCQSPGASSYPHNACVFAEQGKVGQLAEWVLYFISPLALFQCPTP